MILVLQDSHTPANWCIYSLPVGGVSVILFVSILHLPSNPASVSIRQQIIQLDPFGTIIFLPAIVCFLLTLQWGRTTYPWSDARVIALFVIAGLFVSVFWCDPGVATGERHFTSSNNQAMEHSLWRSLLDVHWGRDDISDILSPDMVSSRQGYVRRQIWYRYPAISPGSCRRFHNVWRHDHAHSVVRA